MESEFVANFVGTDHLRDDVDAFDEKESPPYVMYRDRRCEMTPDLVTQYANGTPYLDGIHAHICGVRNCVLTMVTKLPQRKRRSVHTTLFPAQLCMRFPPSPRHPRTQAGLFTRSALLHCLHKCKKLVIPSRTTSASKCT